MRAQRSAHPGIIIRHRKTCPAKAGRRCSCQPSYEAWAYAPRERKKIRETFPTLAAARAWRAEAQTAIRKGRLRRPEATTLAQAAAVWITGAERGLIRTRSGDPYKPSALRGYRAALEKRILPVLGAPPS